MKTTLVIEDSVMEELKREAVRQGRTMSELVESALRLLLRTSVPAPAVRPLPEFHLGAASVDLADREALEELMETPEELRSRYTVRATSAPDAAPPKRTTGRRPRGRR